MTRTTRPLTRRALSLGLCGLLAIAAPAARAEDPAPAPAATNAAVPETNAVRTIEVTKGAEGARLRIQGDREPNFTVFRLDQPSRVVVDLSHADVSAAKVTGTLPQSPVAAVTTRQFDDPRAKVGRVVIQVLPGTRYDVRASGFDLVVELREPTAAPSPAVAAAPAVTMPAPPAAATAAPAAQAEAPRHDDKVVRVEVDTLPGDAPGGTKLLDARMAAKKGVATLRLVTDGPIARYEVVELKEPGRLALDLIGFNELPKAKVHKPAGPVAALRIGRHDGRVRVVMEASGDRFPEFRITRRDDGLDVKVGGKPAAEPAFALTLLPEAAPAKAVATPIDASVAAATPAAAPAAPAATPAPAAPVLAEVKSVDVSGKGRQTRIVVVVDRDVTTETATADDGSHVLTIRGARLPAELRRRLDASALDGSIASVATYPAPGEAGTVRVVAQARDGESTLVGKLETIKVGPSIGLAWTLNGTGPRAPALVASAVRTASPGGFMGEASAYARAAAPRAGEAPRYTGRRVDFTAKDLDIIQFLQAIGEVSKRNIVASDDVSGKVSIRLRDVPWDEALDIVLRTKNLGREDIGKIIRVAPLAVLSKEKEEAAKSREKDVELAPLKTRLIPVNYATADEIAIRVKDVLTARGKVSVDARTNVLIVTDVVESLAKAELLVRSLDTQTPQVSIEARIVEASTRFTQALGVQWGGTVRASTADGNPTGLAFPNIVAVNGGATDGQTPNLGGALNPNYAVNMPAAVGTNSGGGVGFSFGNAGGTALLNLRLSAAETNGTIKTISAPKITTLDNQQATIQQGISVPFSQTSAAGVNTIFVEAALQLAVTPHVTADGAVLLQVRVTNNAPNPQVTGANGQPSIARREATTRVLVKDGDTTVIGGIYSRRNSLSTNEVPFFSKIPVIGNIFKKDTIEDERAELLVFITPTIVNRQQSLVGGADSLPPPPAE